jgi:hypothetical protein
MFDLEPAIANWRRQMLAAGIKTPVPLDELESHLREEIERQMKSGLNEQKAFPIAVERIGAGDLLKNEFKKIGGMDKAQRRKAAGYFYSVILGFYTLAAIYAMSKYNLSTNEWLSGLAAQITLLGLAYLVWNLAPSWFLLITSRRAQSAVGLIGGISGAIWFLDFANFILPRFDFTTGQLMVAVLWAMVPTLVLPTTAFLLLDKSENQPSVTTSS